MVSGEEIMHALITAGTDIHLKTRDGGTALMYAKDVDCVKTLLSQGVDPNKQDSDGTTALMYACRADRYQYYTYKTLQIVQALLQAGADVDLINSSGRTALMMACEAGNSETVKALLEAKSDPNKQDKDGKTALIYASHVICMKVLLSHGANVDLADKSQRTALNYWIEQLYDSTAQDPVLLLLNMGANPVIDGSQRSWLRKVFSQDPTNPILKKGLIYLRPQTEEVPRQFIQLAICNGILVMDTDYHRKFSPAIELPRIEYALHMKHLDVVKYFIANCYLTQKDLLDMRTVLADLRRQCLIQRDHLEETKEETLELLEQAMSQPWPLVKLVFITVSSALGPSPDREYRISQTGLPDRLQRMLMFQEPVSRLPVSEWEVIPLTFDPVEYEKLPKPRPLLYYWPVGRDLVI